MKKALVEDMSLKDVVEVVGSGLEKAMGEKEAQRKME